MSTRGAVGFRINGQDKVTYNHSDSYPSHLGLIVVTFLKAHSAAELKPIAEAIRLVDEDATPSEEERKKYRKYCNTSVGNQTDEDWYCLLRDAQGTPEQYCNGLDVMIDSHTFLSDSLYCEYAYIINLDDGLLEFYRGFNKRAGMPGRYAKNKGDGFYFGVRLVATIPLSEIGNQDDNVLKRFDVIDRRRDEHEAGGLELDGVPSVLTLADLPAHTEEEEEQ